MLGNYIDGRIAVRQASVVLPTGYSPVEVTSVRLSEPLGSLSLQNWVHTPPVVYDILLKMQRVLIVIFLTA